MCTDVLINHSLTGFDTEMFAVKLSCCFFLSIPFVFFRNYSTYPCQATRLFLHTGSASSNSNWQCSLDTHSNVRPTVKCWEVIVIVQSASGPMLRCQLNTYMIVSIRAEALTHTESIMSVGRLHTNYEQHQQMTACTYCCFPVSCPYVIIHLSLRWGHLGLCVPQLH